MRTVRPDKSTTSIATRVARIDRLEALYAEVIGVTERDFFRAIQDDICFMAGARSWARGERLGRAAYELWLAASRDEATPRRVPLTVRLPIELVPGHYWVTRDEITFDGGSMPMTDTIRRVLRLIFVAAIYHDAPSRWPPTIARELMQDMMHWLHAGPSKRHLLWHAGKVEV